MPPEPVARTHVLIVDDDRAFLDMTGELLRARMGGKWEVHLATSTAQALTILREQPIRLVVFDIQMPVVDGIQFLRLLERKYPDPHKVVLTGYGDAARRVECLQHGAELFLEKPHTAEAYENIFAALQELASITQNPGFRGVLREAGLSDVLQMECLGRHSSILEISNPRLHGHIYIQDGEIVHAAAGRHQGVAAFNRLLALAGGDFKLHPFEPPAGRTIAGLWESLVLDATRHRDEVGELAEAEVPEAPAETVEPGVPPPEPDRPAASGADVHVEEVIICSGQGGVLHESQCRNVEHRLKLFRQVGAIAERISQGGGFGPLNRCEVLAGAGRMVIQVRSDRQLLVRTRRGAPPPAPVPAT